jgi:hypothetical protein
LSFPAVQPGTEEPRDLAYLEQIAAQPNAATQSVPTPTITAPSAPQVTVQQPATPPPAAQQTSVPSPAPQTPPASNDVSAPTSRRAGVNSMFDL